MTAVLASMLLACSSAPKQREEVEVKKNLAAESTESGNTYFNRAEYQRALYFFNLALTDNISVDNEPGIAGSYNSIGKAYLALGDLELAQQSFSLALARAYKLQAPTLIAQSLNNLAQVNLIRGEAQKALGLLEEALKQLDPAAPQAEGAVIFHNLGSAYKKLEQWERALEFLRRAVEINLRLKRFAEAANNHYMIASIHSKQGSYPQALAEAGQALAYDKMIESSPGIAKDLLGLGIIQIKAAMYQEACESLLKSYQVYQTLSLPRETAEALSYLILACQQAGRGAEADRYREILKSLQGQ